MCFKLPQNIRFSVYSHSMMRQVTAIRKSRSGLLAGTLEFPTSRRLSLQTMKDSKKNPGAQKNGGPAFQRDLAGWSCSCIQLNLIYIFDIVHSKTLFRKRMSCNCGSALVCSQHSRGVPPPSSLLCMEPVNRVKPHPWQQLSSNCIQTIPSALMQAHGNGRFRVCQWECLFGKKLAFPNICSGNALRHTASSIRATKLLASPIANILTHSGGREKSLFTVELPLGGASSSKLPATPLPYTEFTSCGPATF